MMNTLLQLLLSALLSATLTFTLLTIHQEAYARPEARQFESSGDDILTKKKKIDLRKQKEQELASALPDTFRKFNEQPANNNGDNNDFHTKFHQRQVEKRNRLDQMHAQISEILEAHHSGRKLLSDTELESHTKKQMALERKRKSLNEETSERYIHRMKRHEEKFLNKMERKERRTEERFRKMMDGAAGGGEL